MPNPLAEGLENSFAPQMIFLWPPARGLGKKTKNLNKKILTKYKKVYKKYIYKKNNKK